MSPRSKVRAGLSIGALGGLLGVLVLAEPARLNVPLWVALAASASFVTAGAAVALHAFVSARAYAWCIVALLAVMSCIPAWIAFGPGVRACSANLAVFERELGCRAVFAIGAVVGFATMMLAARSAITK